MTPRRAFLTGLLAAPVLFLALVAVSVSFLPDWPILGEMARIVENVVPQLVLAGLVATAILACLHPPRILLILAAGGYLAAGGIVASRHLAQSLPLVPGETTDLTILWFNVLADNPTDPRVLADALIDSPADIVVLGEAAPLAGQRERLARSFPVEAGCAGENRACQVMVLARSGDVQVDFRRIGRTHEARIATVTPGAAGEGAPYAVVGMHLLKPWFRGFAEDEEWQALHALNGVSGPVIAVGDLNAAPWGRRLGLLSERCGVMSPRLPLPTWPAGAGWLGLPIDHVMVRGGARLVSLETWGAGLGSNHLGLLARVALPDDGPPVPPPPSCRPPRWVWDPSAR